MGLTWLWTRKARSSSPGSGTALRRMTLEGVQPQHLYEIGGQLFTTKRCSGYASLAFCTPFIFLFKGKAAFQDRLLEVECASTARLREKGKIPSYDGKRTAAVSTNTQMKEHKQNGVSYYGLLSVPSPPPPFVSNLRIAVNHYRMHES